MMMVQVIGAFLAIMAFAIMLETPKKYLWCAGAVGAVGWFVYLLCEKQGANTILATFISAAVIAFVSHVFARIFKTPVTVFLIAGILPTVPGAGMYKVVYHLIQKDSELFAHYLVSTLEMAGVIALALFVVDALFRFTQKEWAKKELDKS